MGIQKKANSMRPELPGKILIATVLMTVPFLSFGIPLGDSLGIEVLLNRQICIDAGINGRFIGSLDITPERHILLSTPEKLYSLGWGGLIPFKKNVPVNLNSFAYTPDGFLMGVRSGELVIFDAQANIVKLYNLPEKGMEIAAGNYVMYLYDHNKAKSKHTLFAIARGGKFARLLDVALPIESVVETGSSILFAAGSTIFHFTPKSNELKAIATLPGNRQIRSIAADTPNDRIFFSTDSAVFALKGSNPVIITDSTGGELKYYKNGLIIFNPERSLLLRITGIEAGIAAVDERNKAALETKPAPTILVNETIATMVKSGLSDESIIKAINSSRVDFNLSVDAMVELSGQNVSSAVIMAMKQAMKKQSAKVP
jgi:hypothetical protein